MGTDWRSEDIGKDDNGEDQTKWTRGFQDSYGKWVGRRFSYIVAEYEDDNGELITGIVEIRVAKDDDDARAIQVVAAGQDEVVHFAKVVTDTLPMTTINDPTSKTVCIFENGTLMEFESAG